ncbi:unnamed protein product [Rhizoctonia solani]|uniref:G-patch domain-containing protein n=1 Tax=Rhizoctonia solani TaxID=456999 RepID=A0A8H3DFB4_9AGAM|nr:unnamed protein product [Rhizoctonia solani]
MLDGQTHLAKQGWKGVGHPLKAGGRSRPVVIAQKKTLGGIGKDRDESFAFWDHLYEVAAKTIKLKLPGDESPGDSDQESRNPATPLHRTQTGILSNRRPTSLPTPSSSKSPTPPPPSASIISLVKQEAARRTLYSRFLRGPVITQEALDSNSTTSVNTTGADLGTAPVSASPTPPVPVTTTSTTAVQTLVDGEQLEETEKAARRLAKEERRRAKAARRESREERRKAKAIRDEARAAKEKRKVERAAKRAAKLEKKREKEQRRAQAERKVGLEGTLTPAESDISEGKGERKREKKRKRDGE